MTPEERLSELGFVVPEVVPPVAAYVPALRTGNYVYVSGQVPSQNGELLYTGVVGDDVDEGQAYQCAEQCGLNALAALLTVVGSLSEVKQVVKIVGFVASAPGFTRQPHVINGVSELLGKVFGDAGKHARSAVGVSQLPLGVPVEVEMIVEVG
jgi:enamine deaminase RidA (YjgF/YER057c/UK114 family)